MKKPVKERKARGWERIFPNMGIFPRQRLTTFPYPVRWECRREGKPEPETKMKTEVPVAEADLLRLLNAVSDLLGHHKTIDQAGYFDNYEDAARARAAIPKDLDRLREAYSAFAGPIQYRPQGAK